MERLFCFYGGMETLSFLHLFFQLRASDLGRIWSNHIPTWHEIEREFRNIPLTRRTLQCGVVDSYLEARSLFEKNQKREQALGIRTIVESDPEYPECFLRYLPPERRPLLFYIRGSNLPDEASAIAVVGTRRPSRHGVDSALSFSAYFTALKVHIVSGLAKGIDTIAHQENLSIGTVGVLGGSLDEIYPSENSDLAEEILRKGGTLVSPFPVLQVPLPYNFPIRNEWIAALSCGTLMVEGNEKSGAAITARQTLSMDKTVVVLTQDFRTGYGRGAIRLQQEGAHLVASEEEAFQALFARLGGSSHRFELRDRIKLKRNRTFSLRDYISATGKSLPDALAQIEEAILHQKIERCGAHSYRFLEKKVDA